MNQFIKSITLYLITPLFILGISTELLLRNIPSNYAYKKFYLDKNSDSINVLILGNSHGYYGVNPRYLHRNSFNACYVSQSLNFDFAILEKYNGKWENLNYIILPVSYFTLHHRLEKSPESWRVCNYVIYFGLNPVYKLTDYAEILSNKLQTNLTRIVSYYLHGLGSPICSNLGWGRNYDFKHKQNLIETGRFAAKKHTYEASTSINENLLVLQSIISYANDRNVKILLFTPPAYHTYTENLDAKQLHLTINTACELDKAYQNVDYINLLTDSSFTEKDFYDADHLDEYGAKKLTLKMDSIIAGWVK